MSSKMKRRNENVDCHVYETRLGGWGSAELPLCAYCGVPFEPKRRDQKFGNPKVERHLHWERKEALIRLVADLLARIGGRAKTSLLRVAKLCVEAAYKQFRQAVAALGYKYDQKRKAWRLPPHTPAEPGGAR